MIGNPADQPIKSRSQVLLRRGSTVRRLKLLTGLRRRACVCGLYEHHATPQETLFDRRRSAWPKAGRASKSRAQTAAGNAS